MNDDLRQRLMKLLQLAERGVGGEKHNAKRMLDQALKKNLITVDDLLDKKRNDASWRPKGPLEKHLLAQIVQTVLGASAKLYKYRGGRIGGECTAEEKIKIDILFTTHRRALNEELNLMVSAYIHRQNLFPSDADPTPEKELTPEEKRRIEKLAAMMMGIDFVTTNMQLPKTTQGRRP